MKKTSGSRPDYLVVLYNSAANIPDTRRLIRGRRQHVAIVARPAQRVHESLVTEKSNVNFAGCDLKRAQ